MNPIMGHIDLFKNDLYLIEPSAKRFKQQHKKNLNMNV